MQIKNFSSIREATIPLNNVGLCLVEGINDDNANRSNGTGKTSLVEAFYFGVTGEFFDSGTTHADVVNRFTKEDLEIIIEGEKYEKPFRIIRAIARKKSKTSHSLVLEIDGEPVKTTGIPETQERINNLMGTSPILLLNSRIYGQGEISSFTKVDDRKKKAIIDSIIGLGVFEKYYRKAKDQISNVVTKTTTLKLERDGIQRTVDANNRRLQELQTKEDEWKTKKDTSLEEVRKKLQELVTKVKTLTVNIDALKDKDASTEKETSDQFTELEEMRNKIRAELIKISTLMIGNKGSIAEYDVQINWYRKLINELLTEVDELPKDLESGKPCSKCKQPLSAEHVITIIQDDINKVEQARIILTGLEEKMELELSEVSKYQSRQHELEMGEADIEEAIKAKRAARIASEVVETEISRLVTQRSSLLSQIEVWQAKIQSLDVSGKSPYTDLIQQIDNEVADYLPKLKEKTDELSKLEVDLKYYNFLAKAFDRDGIPHLISERAVEILNTILKKYTQRILGPRFDIQFKSTDKGGKSKLTVQVAHADGGPTYSRCSRGERTTIDLCQMMALSKFADMQNKCNINLMWFDEILGDLDPHNCNAVLEVLRQDPTPSKFVITHKDMFKEEFRNKIMVSKTDKLSEVAVNIGMGVNCNG